MPLEVKDAHAPALMTTQFATHLLVEDAQAPDPLQTQFGTPIQVEYAQAPAPGDTNCPNQSKTHQCRPI